MGVVIPFIWIFVIGSIVFLRNWNLRNKIHLFLSEINGLKILKIPEINCVTSTLGSKNFSLLFRKCDLYIMQDYIVIIGKPTYKFSRQIYKPIIISKDTTGLMTKFPVAIIETIDRMWFNKKGEFSIGFGTPVRTKVEIRFKDLTNIQVEFLQKCI